MTDSELNQSPSECPSLTIYWSVLIDLKNLQIMHNRVLNVLPSTVLLYRLFLPLSSPPIPFKPSDLPSFVDHLEKAVSLYGDVPFITRLFPITNADLVRK